MKVRIKIKIIITLILYILISSCASTPETKFHFDKQYQRLNVYYPNELVSIRLPQSFEMIPIGAPCCGDVKFYKNGEKESIPFLHFVFSNSDFKEFLVVSLTSDFTRTNNYKIENFLETEEELENYFENHSVDEFMMNSLVGVGVGKGVLPPNLQLFEYQTAEDLIDALITVENDQVTLGDIVSISGEYSFGPFQTFIAQSYFNDKPVHLVVSYISTIERKDNLDNYLKTMFFETSGL